MTLALAIIGSGLVLGPVALVRNSRTNLVTPPPVTTPQKSIPVRVVPEAEQKAVGHLALIPVVPPSPQPVAPARLAAEFRPDGTGTLGIEQQLAALSYMVGAVDGVFDRSTAFGMTAFQKIEGLARTGKPDPETLTRLASAVRPTAAYSVPPNHVEVDITRQVVMVVSGGQVTATLPTSTGNGKIFYSQGRRSRAVTPNGQFTVSRKIDGWRRSPLGLLYRPSYIYGGIALHGSKSVPIYPASHGCIRLPMPFADWFAEQASPVGTVVYVYGNAGAANPAATSGAQSAPAYAPDASYTYTPPSPDASYTYTPPPDASQPAPSGSGSSGDTPVLGGLLGG
ncbi:MAG: L,D-transpeptidase family protein [Actinomycetota bacterium]